MSGIPVKQQGPIDVNASPGRSYLSTTFNGAITTTATVPPGETWVISSVMCVAKSGTVYLPDRTIHLTWRRVGALLTLLSSASFGRNTFAYLTAGAGDSDVSTPGVLVSCRALPTIVAVNGDTMTATIVPGDAGDSITMTLNYQVIR